MKQPWHDHLLAACALWQSEVYDGPECKIPEWFNTALEELEEVHAPGRNAFDQWEEVQILMSKEIARQREAGAA